MSRASDWPRTGRVLPANTMATLEDECESDGEADLIIKVSY